MRKRGGIPESGTLLQGNSWIGGWGEKKDWDNRRRHGSYSKRQIREYADSCTAMNKKTETKAHKFSQFVLHTHRRFAHCIISQKRSRWKANMPPRCLATKPDLCKENRTETSGGRVETPDTLHCKQKCKQAITATNRKKKWCLGKGALIHDFVEKLLGLKMYVCLCVSGGYSCPSPERDSV